MLADRREGLPALFDVQSEKTSQPACHRLGQFGVVDRRSGKRTAVLQSYLQQPSQPPSNIIFLAIKRRPVVQHACPDHPRRHVHAGTAHMGNRDFQGVAIQEQPRRVGKALAQERQFTDVPGVELDDQPLFNASAALPVGGHQAHERHAPFSRRQVTAQQCVQGRRFGNNDVVVQLGEHLADQCRAASGGMENERTGLEPRALTLPLTESVQRRLAAERLVERQAQGLLDSIAEEWL
jgi:hypothetical protein